MRSRTIHLLEPGRVLRFSVALCLAGIVYLLACSSSRQPAHRITPSSPASGIFSANPVDFFEAQAAEDLCREHSWRPFQRKPGQPRRKVYDLVMVNTELDWLEIRLNTSYAHVDYFVVVEGHSTFTGMDKPLTVKDNWGRFAAYHDKMIYHEVEYPPGFMPRLTWEYEDLQRDATYTQVFPGLVSEGGARAPSPGDVLVVADVDEIPRPETLAVLRACDFPRRLTLRSRFYYYSFEFLHRGAEWAHPQATVYSGPRDTVLPTSLRNGAGGLRAWLGLDGKAELWNAGWHCSSCFATVAEFLRKMESFSHMDMNKPQFRERERIAESVRDGKDLWGRKEDVFDRIQGNRDVPKILLDQAERFRYLMNRSGASAGFSDYP